MTKMVKMNPRDYNLIIILNTQGEDFVDKLSPFHASNIFQLEKHIGEKRRIIIYNLPDEIPEEEKDNERYDWELFRELADYIWELKRYPENEHKKFLFVIDECDNFQTTGKIMPIYKKMMTKGRKWNLEIWNLTQRPALINKTIFTQSKEIYAFEVSNYDYKEVMSKWFNYENPELYEYVIIKN